MPKINPKKKPAGESKTLDEQIAEKRFGPHNRRNPVWSRIGNGGDPGDGMYTPPRTPPRSQTRGKVIDYKNDWHFLNGDPSKNGGENIWIPKQEAVDRFGMFLEPDQVDELFPGFEYPPEANRIFIPRGYEMPVPKIPASVDKYKQKTGANRHRQSTDGNDDTGVTHTGAGDQKPTTTPSGPGVTRNGDGSYTIRSKPEKKEHSSFDGEPPVQPDPSHKGNQGGGTHEVDTTITKPSSRRGDPALHAGGSDAGGISSKPIGGTNLNGGGMPNEGGNYDTPTPGLNKKPWDGGDSDTTGAGNGRTSSMYTMKYDATHPLGGHPVDQGVNKAGEQSTISMDDLRSRYSFGKTVLNQEPLAMAAYQNYMHSLGERAAFV